MWTKIINSQACVFQVQSSLFHHFSPDLYFYSWADANKQMRFPYPSLIVLKNRWHNVNRELTDICRIQQTFHTTRWETAKKWTQMMDNIFFCTVRFIRNAILAHAPPPPPPQSPHTHTYTYASKEVINGCNLKHKPWWIRRTWTLTSLPCRCKRSRSRHFGKIIVLSKYIISLKYCPYLGAWTSTKWS